LNVGQICLSPDSIYIHERHYDKMIELFKKKIHEFYGNDPFTAVDYSRVINERHVDRVAKLLEGQKITYGGKVDRQNRYVSKTWLPIIGNTSRYNQQTLDRTHDR
jgi:aldehyde dehydrogenase (NAD+)